MIRTGLLSHALIVKKIAGLLVKFPAQPQIQRQVVFNSPVVLEVESNVVFFEAQNRLPVSKLSQEGRVRQERVEVEIIECTVLFKQAVVGRALPVILAAPLHHMAATHQGGIVLKFIDVDNSYLGKLDALTKPYKTG